MIYAFDEYELDTQIHTVRRVGQPIRLRRKAFQSLLYLITHRHEVVSKDKLYEQIWPGQFISDTTLESTIYAVRQALGDTGRTQRLIQTIPGYGYRFIAAVEEYPDMPVRGQEPSLLVPLDASPPLHGEGPDVVPAVPFDTQGERQAIILVVDDQVTVTKRLEALLLPRGYTVITAANGEEALQQVQQAKPDLILLDVMMPGIDGFDICRRLKDRDETRLTPVILMTALGEVQDRIKGLEAGADDFLTKPVHRDELLARIRTSLRLKQTIDHQVRRLRQTLSSAPPLFLTVRRDGDTIAMELTEAILGVPSRHIQIEASLLSEINAELDSILTVPLQQEVLHRPGATDESKQPENMLAALQRLGSLIFTYLFPAPIRQRLIDTQPTTLFLRLDEHLVHVPWELAFDGQEFLLTKFHIGRQVVTPQPPLPPLLENPQATRKYKLFIIVDPTDSLPLAVQEAERLAQRLGMCDQLAVSIASGRGLRKMELLLALRECDFVHYLGYASFDTAQPSRSGWQLHTTVLTAADLGKVSPPPKLVFANTCQPPDISPPPTLVYAGQALQLGSAFLLAGTPHYITSVGGMYDAHSTAFASAFYAHLLQGECVGAALAAARFETARQAGPQAMLWTSYVHYGNPTFHLWPRTGQA